MAATVTQGDKVGFKVGFKAGVRVRFRGKGNAQQP